MILVGTAGWHYDDWKGVVYGAKETKPLEKLLSYFPILEVNVSFYRLPPLDTWKRWRDVAVRMDGFFSVKAPRPFTHDRQYDGSLVEAFVKALAVLASENRLKGVLFQFPYGFHYNKENEGYLLELLRSFSDFPRVVEVRHASFRNRHFIGMLQAEGITLATIDQPRVSWNLPFWFVETGNLAYLRFHGRNTKKWFEANQAWERYDYNYSPQELEVLAERVLHIAEKMAETVVIFNNHYRGKAFFNGLALMDLLGLPHPSPPERQLTLPI